MSLAASVAVDGLGSVFDDSISALDVVALGPGLTSVRGVGSGKFVISVNGKDDVKRQIGSDLFDISVVVICGREMGVEEESVCGVTTVDNGDGT